MAMENNYISLHVHSDYSRQDSVAKIEDLVNKAKLLKMPALALTDHGTVSGWIRFYKTCMDNGIKPIFGIEAYIVDNADFFHQLDKDIDETEKKAKDWLPLFDGVADDFDATIEDLKDKKNKERKANHVIILAKNEVGYRNILRLSSWAYVNGFYYKPRIDMKVLEKFKEGLIITSACLGGQIASNILRKDYTKAEFYTKQYKEIFGDDFYMEIQLHPVGEQEEANRYLIKLAKKHKIKTIITQDVHYVEQADVEVHETIIKLKNKEKDKSLEKDGDIPRKVDVKREAGKIKSKRSALIYEQLVGEAVSEQKQGVDSDGYFYNAREYYFKSYDELENSRKTSHSYISEEDFKEYMANTFEIADKVERMSAYSTQAYLPKFGNENETAQAMLKRLIREGAKKKLADKIKKNPELKKVYDERLSEEVSVIFDLGFEEYFLIVWDFITWARQNDVAVGPGRGSVGGSLIAYCIDITRIDPIQHGLLFSRFINKTRSVAKYKIDFDGFALGKK
jgi:DNA polymerase-3 subunit alpha